MVKICVRQMRGLFSVLIWTHYQFVWKRFSLVSTLLAISILIEKKKFYSDCLLMEKVLYLQMSQINLKYLVCLANTGLEPLLPLEL